MITRCTGWPEAVAMSFWRCIRNPVIHMGRYHGLSDYGSRAGSDVPILASLEFIRPYTPDPPSEGEFPPTPTHIDYSAGRAWRAYYFPGFEESPADASSGPHVTLLFNMYRVLDTVQSMIRGVADRLRAATPEDLEELRGLNQRLPFLSAEALDPRLEADEAR